MFLKSLKTIIIFAVLYVGIVSLAKPQILQDLEKTSSNEEVERLVNERWNATRNNPFIHSTFFRGANMFYHGSKLVGLEEKSFLGRYVFTRRYNSATGETDHNSTKFIPSPIKSVSAFVFFVLVYWWLLLAFTTRKRAKE